MPEEIRNQKLVAVEGSDDVGFFVRLLDKMNVHNYFVLPVDGKGNFNEELPSLKKLPGFPGLTHFAVIRDQDKDQRKSAFSSIANILHRKMDFQVIPSKHGEWTAGTPKIGIFIMPGETIQGKAIEDLCLKIVENHSAMECVNDFESCVSVLKNPPKNLSKVKVLAFLAAQPEFANSIGLGAKKDYWDFNSSALDELKQFLSNLK